MLPGSCKDLFFGERFIAIKKSAGDVRPIVIGFVLRRLASKLANSFGLARIASPFSPLQVGAGVKGGCEAAIHAARRFIGCMGDDDVLVKLDFKNAFNSLHRADFFQEVKTIIPEIALRMSTLLMAFPPS